jgi:hypothetical protein
LITAFHLRIVHQWSTCTCVHDCRIHNEGMKTIIKLYVGLYSQYWSLWFQPGNLATIRDGARYTVFFVCSRELSVQMLNSSYWLRLYVGESNENLKY